MNEKEKLIKTLKDRFDSNMQRHKNAKWSYVLEKLNNESLISSLLFMENTGGEPDVIGTENDEYYFFDCSAESPKERRSLCYDREALLSRKENKPVTSAIELSLEMNAEILTEEDYRLLQTFGDFDLKTSSWIKTPTDIREKGGAIFCDKRYGRVFTYHNGAESYYSSRGFRAKIKI